MKKMSEGLENELLDERTFHHGTGKSAKMEDKNTATALLSRLVVDGGTRALRHLFDSIHSPSSLQSTLRSKEIQSTLKGLKQRNIITSQQWKKLSSTPVNSENFDIALLFALLCHICDIRPPSTGWDKLPYTNDLSRGADLVRVRYFREKLYGCIMKQPIKCDVTNDWSEISDVLVRLAGPHFKAEIEKLKSKPLYPEDRKCFFESIKVWEEHYIPLHKRLFLKYFAIVNPFAFIVKSLGIGRLKTGEVIKEKTNTVQKQMPSESEPYAARCEGKASGATSEIDTSVDQAQKESLTAEKYSDRLKMAIRNSTEYNRPKFTTEDHDVTCGSTDDFFTNLTVYYADEKQEETVQAKGGRNRSLLQKYAKRSKKVEKCEDIFTGMKAENPNLLLTGDPGVGKTLFCEKAIRDWSMDRLFQNETSPNIKFAFLLKFRHFSKLGDKTINLQELLNCSPLLDSTIDDSFFECLTNKPSEVLILLDGFHEYSVQHREQITSHFEEKFPDDSRAKMLIPALVSKLMRGKLLGNAVVLVTTRPGAVDELREISFERYVEVSGFSPEQVTQYVMKYFSDHNEELTRNTALEFVENNYENLVSFCHIPLTAFLLCWCLEWRISQSGKLPAKTTELYYDVVEIAVQELLENLEDFEMPAENVMKIVQDTMDKLAKIANNLTKEDRYIFDEEDMKKEGLSEDEIERLKVSGILHYTPGIQNPIFQTENEFRFLHLTLQEWLSASFCVKNKVIPGKNEVSGQTFVFMSGLSSNEKDGRELMTKLIEQIAPRDKDDDVHKLLMLKCLYEHADDQLTKQTINDLYHTYCDGDGWIGFHGVTDVDMVLISYLLDIIRSSVQPVRGRALFIRGSSLTSFGVRVLFKSLRSSFITEVDLSNCSLDDESLEEIINVLPNTGITRLNLHDTTIIKLTKVGGLADIPKIGVFLQFPRKTVESPTQVVCRSSHENIPSPEADMMETLVSHLVQLGPSTVELRDPVTVTLLHAGPGKKSGYETVVKAYHHDEQVWKEIEVIQPEFKDTSYIPKNFKVDNLIQVKISKLTPLAVISRLITDNFEVTPTGCVVKSSVSENVTVTFPEGAVDRTVHGSMKLVLVPEMIFLFDGFEGIQFLKPVTVKFPYRRSTDDFPGHLRVLFQEDTVPPEDPWNDVTHDVKLEKKEPGFLELQVQHFSRWRISSYTEPIINFLRSPQHVFLGAFKRENDPGLKLTIVCGSILRVENNNEEAAFIGNGYRTLACSTSAEMRINQKAYLNVKDYLNIIQIVQPTQENFHVKFLGKDYRPFQKDLVYNIDSLGTTANMNDQIFLGFYPNIEYVEEEQIGELAITRCRLYPEPEGLERLLDIDPEPPRNENSPQNSFVKPTRLEHIPHENKPRSDLVYKMTRSPRGISYIFNMKNFSSSTNASHGIQLDQRCGSESDVESLRRLFEALDFTVRTVLDRDKRQLMVELQSIISGSDFSSYDCLVVFIMSHGYDNYIYASDGEEVRLKAEIFDLFQDSKCRTFRGKPKLFFIQACRETKADPGVGYDDSPVEQATSQANKPSDLNRDTYECDPEFCDNLYAYSCFEGHKSFRWKEGGGFYVNHLVKVFSEYAHNQDVLSMLTMINKEVSEVRCEWGKQMPCSTSTLRKKVFFWPGVKF